jgi:hypothetical protein
MRPQMSRPQTLQSRSDDRAVSSQLVPFYINSIDFSEKKLCVKSARLVWKILHYISERELPRLSDAGNLTQFQNHLDRLFEEIPNSHRLVNRVILTLFDLLQNSDSDISNLRSEIGTDPASIKLCFVHFTRYYGIKTIQSQPGKFPYRIPYQGEILMDLLGGISQEPRILYSSIETSKLIIKYTQI